MSTTLGLTTQTILGKEEYKKADQVINTLYDNNDALEFRQPVDYKSLGLNDYLTIVKTPMDLGCVKRNMKNNKYQYVEEMLNDIQLVWDNCKSYNQEHSNSKINLVDLQAGGQAGKVFQEINKKLFTKYSLQYILLQFSELLEPAVKKPSGQSQIGQPYGNFGQYAVEDAQSDAKYDEITYQEKLALSNKVKYLSQEKLGEIIKLIQDQCPDAFNDVDKDRCQILVDNISKEVFNEINLKLEEWILTGCQKVQKKIKQK